MTDHPILFNAPMIRAILREIEAPGTGKTQTRRIITPQPELYAPGRWHVFGPGGGVAGVHTDDVPREAVSFLRIHPGDRLFPAMPIPSLNRNYCADVHGRVWSRATNGVTWRVLSPGRTSKGYFTVTPANDGKYRTRAIHKLVAEAYYGPAPDGMDQVRHLNGDQQDNAPENLDWGTQADNWTDRTAHGRGSGEEHHSARLTSEQAAEILTSSKSQRALARQFGIAQATVWAIKNNLSWRQGVVPSPPNYIRWASRLTLYVTDVRVERLQDIGEADAQSEGLQTLSKDGRTWKWGIPDRDGLPGTDDCGWPWADWQTDPRAAYARLWNVINGPGAWEANPWVAAYTFAPRLGNIDVLPATLQEAA